jgi:hypothetical protein
MATPKITILGFIGVVAISSGCITRQEIKAYTWLNNSPIPDELCAREPALQNYGFYRRLNNKKFEFISFCDPRANDWVAFYNKDLEAVLDKLLPKKRDGRSGD